jgi:hypothetical protein
VNALSEVARFFELLPETGRIGPVQNFEVHQKFAFPNVLKASTAL